MSNLFLQDHRALDACSFGWMLVVLVSHMSFGSNHCIYITSMENRICKVLMLVYPYFIYFFLHMLSSVWIGDISSSLQWYITSHWSFNLLHFLFFDWFLLFFWVYALNILVYAICYEIEIYLVPNYSSLRWSFFS